MKTSFGLALSFVMLCSSVALAQNQEAVEACRDVNPPGVWQDCIKNYEAKLEKLRQDPAWQAEQRRQDEQRRRYTEQKKLREQEIELRKRQIEVQQQQQQQQQRQNCTFVRTGNIIQQWCN